MKVKCPICGIEGFLQQRGNSYRIQHYRGYVNGKRIYEYHNATRAYLEQILKLEVNGSKSLEVKLLKNDAISREARGCRLVWSRLGDLGSLDPGSNPGSPTSSARALHRITR